MFYSLLTTPDFPSLDRFPSSGGSVFDTIESVSCCVLGTVVGLSRLISKPLHIGIAADLVDSLVDLILRCIVIAGRFVEKLQHIRIVLHFVVVFRSRIAGGVVQTTGRFGDRVPIHPYYECGYQHEAYYQGKPETGTEETHATMATFGQTCSASTATSPAIVDANSTGNCGGTTCLSAGFSQANKTSDARPDIQCPECAVCHCVHCLFSSTTFCNARR